MSPIPYLNSNDDWTQQQAPAIPPVNMAPTVIPQMPEAPRPQIAKIPTPLESNIANDQQQLQKVRWNQAHPWGTAENHPGVAGKIAHVLSVAGNIAGNIVAPNTMALMPGTQLGMATREGGLTHRLNEETQELSQNNDRDAQAQKLALENQNEPQAAADEHDSSSARTKLANAQAEALNNKEPNLAQAYSTAVTKAVAEGRDPSQDPVVQHLSDAIVALQPGQNKAPKLEYQTTLGPDGKPHVFALDEQGNKVKDEGVHYERPMSVNVNAGLGALDREVKQFGGSHQKAVESANAQLEKIDEARNMINGPAEAQALGVPKVMTALVSGQGSGVRITQAELSAIAHARGISGDIEGTLRQMQGGGHLTPVQQKQLTSLLDGVKQRIIEKQAISSGALDAINSSNDRNSIIQADTQARKNLSDLERYGHYAGQTVTLKNGQRVTIQHVHADGSFD